MCFSCGKSLSWTELVPIASFLTQHGKCAGCRTKISWQYPLVEALVGFLFVFLFFRFEYILLSVPLLFGILFAYFGIILCVLVVLAVYDLRHEILPDSLSVAFAILAFISMFVFQGDALILHIPSGWHFVAGLALPAPFALIWLVSKGRWMGLGDAKLMIGIGWLLGLSAGITVILLSFWIGALFSIVLIFCASFGGKKVSMKTAIPFGPFLVLGTVIVFLAQLDFNSIISVFMRF
jgi:prepilin signal peptidase PulO-like enzyme (type II secretory pathway)